MVDGRPAGTTEYRPHHPPPPPQAISSRLGGSTSTAWNTFGAQLRNASARRERGGGVRPDEDTGTRALEIRILLENLVHPVVKFVISSSKGYRTCAARHISSGIGMRAV